MAISKETQTNLMKIAQEHRINCCAFLGMYGGAGWLNYVQAEENDYIVELSVPGSFDEYKTVKTEVVEEFAKLKCILSSEDDMGKNGRFSRKLYFMDKMKYEEQKAKEEEKLQIKYIENESNIHAEGATIGSVNSGSGNTTNNQSVINHEEKDKKWFQKEIVRTILGFISGVASTLIVQWLIKKFG